MINFKSGAGEPFRHHFTDQAARDELAKLDKLDLCPYIRDKLQPSDIVCDSMSAVNQTSSLNQTLANQFAPTLDKCNFTHDADYCGYRIISYNISADDGKILKK